jgi:ribosomal protein S18 acetylase RimI-like enzyme
VATYRENPGFVFDWEIPGTRGIREVNIEGVTVLYGYDGKSAHLASIRTRTKDQGKGKARAVLERFCEEADALGIPIKLEASPLTKKVNRGRLVAFYESLGFVKTGRTINPAGDPEMVRPPRRANPEGIDGDALAAWCASDESYAVLDETASAGSSWMAGACVLLAKALVATHPEAQLVGLEVDGDVQHVGALVGDVVYDALGAHSERRWARDWLAYEQLDPRTPARLVSLEGVPASALPDAEAPATARDVRLVARALPA